MPTLSVKFGKYIVRDWKLKTAKISAADLKKRFDAPEINDEAVDGWKQQVDKYETELSTKLTLEHKNRVINFLQALRKNATLKELEDALVSLNVI